MTPFDVEVFFDSCRLPQRLLRALLERGLLARLSPQALADIVAELETPSNDELALEPVPLEDEAPQPSTVTQTPTASNSRRNGRRHFMKRPAFSNEKKINRARHQVLKQIVEDNRYQDQRMIREGQGGKYEPGPVVVHPEPEGE